MRIGIDARFLVHGIGRYTVELLRQLATVDHESTYYVFTGEDERHRVDPFADLWSDRVRRVHLSGSLHSPSAQVSIPRAVLRHQIDLWHATSFPSPLWRACPFVVTIHDQAPRVDPRRLPYSRGLRGRIAPRYYRLMNAYAVRYARRVITVSEAARRDILQFHPRTPPDKITVIYHGVGTPFGPVPDAERRRVSAALALAHPYFLYVGTVNPGKNLVRVLEAFDTLCRQPGWSHDLVAVARTDTRYGDFYRYWDGYGSRDRVRLLDYVETPDLPGLYAGATALVFPSLHESFGFPLLEAFACGTPVVTSDTSALPEIAGDAALLVDPRAVSAIVEACRRLAGDPVLRSTLIERGFRRMEAFSWRRCAEETLRVYRRVLDEPSAARQP